jgi:EAL domain-containing protein (putative c-di-GMP-specific phosphodiesterase class I)
MRRRCSPAADAVELYRLGCEYAQGFAFDEPMDADAAMRRRASHDRYPAKSRGD